MKYSDKIKLRGWTDSLRNDDDFNELIELISLQYSNLTTAPPYVRLIYSLVVSGIKVHQVNSFLSKRGKILRESQEEKDNEEKSEKINVEDNKHERKVNE